MTEITFNQEGTFKALNAAKNWLRENGYSYGSTCVDMPIGVLIGNWTIAKWRNLTNLERNQLDGKITSIDFREGPVVIILKEPATKDEILSGMRIEPQVNGESND